MIDFADSRLRLRLPNGPAVVLDPIGAAGSQGDDGEKGWSPVHAIVADGERRVERIVDFVGGSGAKPDAALGMYVSDIGYVTDISLATDVRGEAGASGQDGAQGDPGAVIIGEGADVLTGDGPPSDSIGVDNQLYLDNIASTLYKKITGHWILQTTLKGQTGPKGDKGDKGDIGNQGIPGTAGAQGVDGAPGAAGPAGANGAAGPAGADGSDIHIGAGAPASTLGLVGDLYVDNTNFNLYDKTSSTSWHLDGSIRGANGTNGVDGATILTGPGAPSSSLGKNGDLYIDTTSANRDVYTKTAGSWGSPVTTLRGPAGPTGAPGADGAQGIPGTPGTPGAPGANGSTIFNGSGAPASGLGNNGDIYIDTSNDHYYTKGSGTWTDQGSMVGPAGATGSAGAAGAAGPAGPTGSTGAAGTSGSVWYTGAVAPTTLHNDGDYYLRSNNGEVYKQITGAWVDQGFSLIGPQGTIGPTGSAGSTGPAGSAGLDGATIRNGSGVPASGLGNNNDLYINSANNHYYLKISGAWVDQGSMVGPAGATGPAGADGVVGATILVGTGAPASGLGNVNDLYINNTNNDYYSKTTSTVWTLKGNMGQTLATQAEAEAGTDNLHYMSSLRTAQAIAALGGGGGGSGVATVNWQSFATSGTWTKPSGASMSMLRATGAGGSGAGGARNLSATARAGGSGGSGAGTCERFMSTSELPSTLTITVAGPSTGGLGGPANGNTGFPGANGGNTFIGSGSNTVLIAGGGAAGILGSNAMTADAFYDMTLAMGSHFGGELGVRGNISTAFPNDAVGFHGIVTRLCGGGGGGAGNGAGVTNNAPGGSGGLPWGAAGGAVGGTGTANGANATAPYGGGAGGGASATTGGNGGDGAAPGGGGGGGGSGTNSTAGNGGAGARGQADIFTVCGGVSGSGSGGSGSIPFDDPAQFAGDGFLYGMPGFIPSNTTTYSFNASVRSIIQPFRVPSQITISSFSSTLQRRPREIIRVDHATTFANGAMISLGAKIYDSGGSTTNGTSIGTKQITGVATVLEQGDYAIVFSIDGAGTGSFLKLACLAGSVAGTEISAPSGGSWQVNSELNYTATDIATTPPNPWSGALNASRTAYSVTIGSSVQYPLLVAMKYQFTNPTITGIGGGGVGHVVKTAYTFDATTTDANPGAGKFRFNATLGGGDQTWVMYISTADGNGVDMTAFFDSFTPDIMSNVTLTMYSTVGSTSKRITAKITSRTTATGYRKFTLEALYRTDAGPPIPDASAMIIQWDPARRDIPLAPITGIGSFNDSNSYSIPGFFPLRAKPKTLLGGRAYFAPFKLTSFTLMKKMNFIVSTAATSGACRAMIYKMNLRTVDGLFGSGAKVLDSGSADTTQLNTTGTKILNLSGALGPGYYWAVLAIGTISGTLTLQALNGIFQDGNIAAPSGVAWQTVTEMYLDGDITATPPTNFTSIPSMTLAALSASGFSDQFDTPFLLGYEGMM